MIYSASSMAGTCDLFFKEDLYKKIVDTKTCRFESGSGNSKFLAEVIFIKDNCQQMEGSKKESCYMIRVCPYDVSKPHFQSQTIYQSQLEESGKCKLQGVDTLVGSKFEDPRSPIKGELSCDKNQAIIELSNVAKKSKRCELKF